MLTFSPLCYGLTPVDIFVHDALYLSEVEGGCWTLCKPPSHHHPFLTATAARLCLGTHEVMERLSLLFQLQNVAGGSVL